MKAETRERLIRMMIITVYAEALLQQFMYLVYPFVIPMDPLTLHILYIATFNLASEGNLLIDKRLNKTMPWFTNPQKRLLVQLGGAILWSLAVVVITFSIKGYLLGGIPDSHFPMFAVYSFAFGGFFLIVLNGVYIARNFFNNWKTSLLEIERLKQEKLKTDYKLLQDQVNPHFLFNSLNVLISEISRDQPTAIMFTRKLSQVYRYVLQSRNQEVVTLRAEIEFIRSILYLHQARVGEALKYEISIPDDALEKKIPPMTIQILVENAIKHNSATLNDPLVISIVARTADAVTVTNTLRLKEAIDSTKTGLTNIRDRYRLLAARDIIIQKTDAEFSVTVALLDD
ncbi:MAG TPA: histidine kinase [Bacteroidota bacterium]|nr:histidine kinase [Bacteroidota bacterium]